MATAVVAWVERAAATAPTRAADLINLDIGNSLYVKNGPRQCGFLTVAGRGALAPFTGACVTRKRANVTRLGGLGP